MKSINILVFSIISFLFTTTVFAQDLSDQEIGFDEARVINSLREYGVTDPEGLTIEIERKREMFKVRYLEMKKKKQEILEKIELEQNTKKRLHRNVAVDIPQSEKDALLAIYNSTNGANWKNNKGWDFNKPVTSWNGGIGWYGVTVVNGHVVKLSLSRNSLSGILPPEIGQLKYLTFLDLERSGVSGSIPKEIGQLENLHFVDARYNGLTGSIPAEIGQLKKLSSIALGRNGLTGSIPVEFYNLTALSSLSLAYNKLSGTLLPDVNKLINLTHLDFENNDISGSIPLQIGELNKLQYLGLDMNKLTGSIPDEIYNLQSLTTLMLDYNGLDGTISSKINKLKNLRTLILYANKLTGSIPPEIGQLDNLVELQLGVNQLTGFIPKEIGLLKNIVRLYLDRNQLTGTIPKEIEMLTKLRFFGLDYNQLTGTLPPGLKDLTNLYNMDVSNNFLEGSVPDLRHINTLGIISNKFRFIDFASEFSLYKTKMSRYNFKYNSQKKTDTAKTTTARIGGSITLTMCEDGRFTPDDTFQWYKNNAIISGATSREYALTDLKNTDAGTYFCRSYHTTNPDMSPLILEREPIQLNVINCTPIVGVIKVVR
ncbi:hypothetical protein OIU80_11730 [Flavobacterium sp. LS1R47]|uniref:Ig-like domain-containing protein n=1 Tax=Flavobacterium frigoritolerans TaxID=2987686 RepID=A0A9X3C1U7_9FLAO|nr:immunoglobulin domain-containing protein [Flavobacterium frigoritolerans]MCV9932951.1 hypothetical protein [Flavobacterium frigoritolerans]